MNRIILVGFVSLFLLITILSCSESYDSELQTPDIDNAGMDHGYNLTSLGSLVYRPWNIDSEDSLNLKGLNNLIFEFQKDGTLFYWFKEDYLKSPIDTVTLLDGNKSYGHTIRTSKELLSNNWLKNIYKNGSWKASFQDSVIQISFGENEYSLLPIKGKFIQLGADQMVIKQGENELQKVYLTFNHY